MPKRILHTWRVFKIRKKLERLGRVKAATEKEAVELASKSIKSRIRQAPDRGQAARMNEGKPASLRRPSAL